MGEAPADQNRIDHLSVGQKEIGQVSAVRVDLFLIVFQRDPFSLDQFPVDISRLFGHKVTSPSIMVDLGRVDTEIAQPSTIFQEDRVAVINAHYLVIGKSGQWEKNSGQDD